MKIIDVINASPETPKPEQNLGRILVSPETANVVRKVAKHKGWTLDHVVQAMLAEWVPKNTSLIVCTDDPKE